VTVRAAYTHAGVWDSRAGCSSGRSNGRCLAAFGNTKLYFAHVEANDFIKAPVLYRPLRSLHFLHLSYADRQYSAECHLAGTQTPKAAAAHLP
jgi:hypothetical protein